MLKADINQSNLARVIYRIMIFTKYNTSCFAQLSNWAFKFQIQNKFNKLGYSFRYINHNWNSIIYWPGYIIDKEGESELSKIFYQNVNTFE